MIILNNNNTNVNLPNYDDLVNKPSINGVVLEGNKTAGELGIDIDTTNFYTKREVNERIADSITGIENEFGNYYTKSQSDGKYQPKGNYLTSIPSEYVTETELQQKDFATNSDVNDEIGKLDSSLSFEIGKKQDTLVSGTNIKTINGISLLGDGNIVITGSGEGGSVDLSDYYTKGEVDNLIDNVEVDLTGYATETYVSDNYQPKGNYLTSIPNEYITETELNDAIAELGGSESVAYLIIKENASDNTFNYVGGSFEDVVNAYNNNKPYFIYVPNGAGVGYYSLAETTVITNTYIQCLSFAHTGVTHTWRYWRLYSDEPILYNQTTYEYATTTQLNSKQNTLVSGENIKTVNGNSILGSGDLVITTDLSNYYTKSEIDNQIGNINTILENILN